MKKYVFFDGTLRQGGAERVISILSDKLSNEGYDVEILIYHDVEPFYSLNENVRLKRVRKETGTKNIFKNLLWMRKYFKENAEVVISFLAPFNMLALTATLFSKIKIIVADRNDPKYVPNNRLVRFFRNWLYQFADGIVVQTQNNKKYFSKKIQEKSTVIYNPIDLKEKYGTALYSAKRKQIVSVGRLIEQKNPLQLLKTFKEFRKTHSDYELYFYGEGNLRTELEEYISKNNLSNCVFLPGVEKNIFDKIITANMFVMCSSYEGMPNALMEAMCLGLPVISTKVSGATDLIKNNVNGILFDIGDDKQLLQSMNNIADNESLRMQLALEATKVRDVLDFNKIITEWIEFIKKVCR